jgi:purine-nucleoside phosphorylase
MEAAALLRVAALRGAAAACLLAVSDVPRDGGMLRIEPEDLESAGLRLGRTAFAALG